MDRRAGRLRIRHRPLRGRGQAIGARAAEAAAAADEDEFAGPPRAAGAATAIDGLVDPSSGRVGTESTASSRSRSRRRRWPPTPALSASSRPSTPTRWTGSRSHPRPAPGASSRPRAVTPTCRRWPRGMTGARRGSGSASPAARPGSTRRDRARGRRAGDRDDRRRRARVALLSGRPRPDGRRLLRRPARIDDRRRRRPARPIPLAGQVGEEVAGEAFVLHDDGLDPGGFATAPIDGEGLPRRRTALIEGGRAPDIPLRHLHRPPRERRVDRERRPRRLPIAALGLRLEPCRRARFRRFRGAARRGRRRGLDQRCRWAALGGQPGHRGLLGRRLGAGDQRRHPLRAAARVHDRERPGLDAARRSGGRLGARWVPFGGSVSTPPLLIGEMAISGS